MPTSNYHYLDSLLSPLNTLDVETEVRLAKIDPNEELAMKQALREVLQPFFRSLTEEGKVAVENALRYSLTTAAPFEDILDSQQECPLGIPADARQFFLWTWEVLFPGRAFLIEELDAWVVEDNPEAAVLRSSNG